MCVCVLIASSEGGLIESWDARYVDRLVDSLTDSEKCVDEDVRVTRRNRAVHIALSCSEMGQ